MAPAGYGAAAGERPVARQRSDRGVHRVHDDVVDGDAEIVGGELGEGGGEALPCGRERGPQVEPAVGAERGAGLVVAGEAAHPARGEHGRSDGGVLDVERQSQPEQASLVQRGALLVREVRVADRGQRGVEGCRVVPAVVALPGQRGERELVRGRCRSRPRPGPWRARARTSRPGARPRGTRRVGTCWWPPRGSGTGRPAAGRGPGSWSGCRPPPAGGRAHRHRRRPCRRSRRHRRPAGCRPRPP